MIILSDPSWCWQDPGPPAPVSPVPRVSGWSLVTAASAAMSSLMLTRKCQHYNHYMTTWPTEITKMTETSAKFVDFLWHLFKTQTCIRDYFSYLLHYTIIMCTRNDVFVSCFFLSILIKVNPPKPELILTLAFRAKTQGAFWVLHHFLSYKVLIV